LENVKRKVNFALNKIRASDEEGEKIIELTTKALRRAAQRRQNGNGHTIMNDPILLELKTEAEELLGKRRANKFFQICNDPYF